jgi:hypothetical protein
MNQKKMRFIRTNSGRSGQANGALLRWSAAIVRMLRRVMAEQRSLDKRALEAQLIGTSRNPH